VTRVGDPEGALRVDEVALLEIGIGFSACALCRVRQELQVVDKPRSNGARGERQGYTEGRKRSRGRREARDMRTSLVDQMKAQRFATMSGHTDTPASGLSPCGQLSC